MEDILNILLVILFYINFLEVILFNFHMFQLNFYKTKWQMTYLRDNALKIFVKNIGYLFIFISLFFDLYGKFVAIIFFLITMYINRIKEAKKPLVYTSRVKRLLIMIAVVTTIVLFLLYSLCSIKVSLYIMSLLCLLSPFVLLIFNYINMPIEKVISRWYINDAKKILKSMPDLIVIGVTGSYGKTSVKTFLEKVLSEKYNVLVTPENYNTTLGVVKTIREKLRATHQVFICEMGATNVGDIKEICDIVKPKYGIITAIGEQHLESFGSIDNIIKTKFELAEAVPDEGTVFLNYDNKYISEKKINKNVVRYGINDKNNDYYAYDIEIVNNSLNFKTNINEEEIILSTKVLGKHNVLNILAVIAVAQKLNVPVDKIIKKVASLPVVPHRLELIKTDRYLILDDTYNSNPNGAKSALETLNIFNGIKILITPGMIELGEKQYECNYEFGKQAARVCEYIVLVGKKQTKPIYDGIVESKFNLENLFIVESLKEAIKQIEKIDGLGKQKIVLMENDLPDNF